MAMRSRAGTSVSDSTVRVIETLEPWFQPFAIELINSLRAYGLPAIATSGRRTLQRQQELIAAGLTKATKSRHLQGTALDVGFLGYRAAQVPPEWWALAGDIWEEMGGRWGGRFQTPDVLHFDAG